VREWQRAGELAGCPWDFAGCEGLGAALECVWRRPLGVELEAAFAALRPRVRGLRVARCGASAGPPRFAVVYALAGGQELFGGEPLEHAVGLELGAPQSGAGALACLWPLLRVHDGFGVLLAPEHLPALLGPAATEPGGSCFYLHPRRALRPLAAAPQLVRFARVDRHCCACVDASAREPRVVYVDRGGEQNEDEESPLAFAAETVRNIAG